MLNDRVIELQIGDECKSVAIQCWLTYRVPGIVNLGVNGKGNGTNKADAPEGGDYSNGPLEAAHRVQMQGMTNGQEPLHGERDDGQHRHVRRPAMYHRVIDGVLAGNLPQPAANDQTQIGRLWWLIIRGCSVRTLQRLVLAACKSRDQRHMDTGANTGSLRMAHLRRKNGR